MATILVADDRPLNRKVLVSLLGYQGHRVLEAGDGREALTLAAAEHPALVIADILMPTMDGYELVREMRGNPALADIPVIFSSAHYNEREARELAQSCGVRNFLPKPCDAEVVLKVVATELQGQAESAAQSDYSDFDREHLRLVTYKLSQKADALQATNERLRALIDFGLKLRSELDHTKLFSEFCQTARTLLAAKHSIVAILDDAGTDWRYFSTSGIASNGSRLRPPIVRIGLVGRLLARLEPIVRCDLPGAPEAVGLPKDYPAIFSFLGVPVASPSRIYGWLCLTNKLGLDGFSDDDRDLAISLATQVAHIYENPLLYEELTRRNMQLEGEIAERRDAEIALRTSEERFRDIAEAATDWIWETDANLRFTYISDRIRDLGLNPTTLRGTRLWEIATPIPVSYSAQVPFEDHLRNHLAFRDIGYELPATEGRLRLFKICGKPVLDATGDFLGYRGTGTDITALHQAEEELRQAQKMEAVGRLTSGIAHDFNNLLTVILGNSETLAEKLSGDPALRPILDNLTRAAERSADLTKRLLAFSRQQTLAPIETDLRKLIGGMKDFLERTIGNQIEIHFKMAKTLSLARVDPSQLENALINLAANARDAMPDGGMLTIETAEVELDADYAAANAEVKPGPYVMVAVSDTGTGIPREIRDRVFEPFFTTKDVGRGSGLGLSMVYGFVKQSNGHVKIESEFEHATTVRLYLPRATVNHTFARE
jgi:PAS domain S-box-containing protein